MVSNNCTDLANSFPFAASLGLKVSEMEDWEESDNEDSDEGSDKEGANKKPKKSKII